ncbi:hypothetical protein [Streptosporangium sp. 'caverna']|uniref:hypothetical protein n=1 Tax=Streptosporangium sp. 'caverna' TaxID=2202249 RepID=UPI000D7D3DB9|nr:hypothetical protein [Streptosporangium sp. 'caverna']AWS40338.1 hypothetical protein DKM19_02310 [Streptosporangium sp. 'caverna']
MVGSHDLRHTGNLLAAEPGAGLKDLMTRMSHDTVRTAMICRHAVRGAGRTITDAIDRQVVGRDVEPATGEWGARFNTTRPHPAIGHLPPEEYEAVYYARHHPSQLTGIGH